MHPNLAEEIIFRQDGAPPHCGRKVRNYLNNAFPEKRIGRRETMNSWPHPRI
jgi:hypothetical protein